MLKSFRPFIHSSSRILILGTMPGPEALRKREYYGYEHNAFWKIMKDLFLEGGRQRHLSYKEKKALLKENRIALWDVLHSCTRRGASDSSIRDIKPNDLVRLLKKYPSVHTLFLNGKTARKFYNDFFAERIKVAAHCLPSTSPAHASVSYEKKLKDWSVIKRFIQNRNPWC